MNKISYFFSVLAYITFTLAIFPVFLHSDSSGESGTIQLIFFAIYGVIILLALTRFKYITGLLKSNISIIVLTFFIIISTLWAVVPEVSIRRTIAYVFTVIVGVYWASRYSPKEMIQIAFTSISIIVLLSYYFIFFVPSIGVHQDLFNLGDWRGVFTHKNAFGNIMTNACLISTLYIFSFRDKKCRVFGTIILALCFIALFFSDSKTSLLVVIGTLLITFWLRKRNKTNLYLFLSISTFLLTLIVIFINYFNTDVLFTLLNRNENLTGRTAIWQISREYISMHPLLGYGFQSFWLGNGPGGIIWSQFGAPFPNAHNGVLDILLQIGLIGLCVFIFVFVIGLRSSYKLQRKSNIEYALPFVIIISTIFFNISETNVLTHNSTYWALFIYAICRSNIELKTINSKTPNK